MSENLKTTTVVTKKYEFKELTAGNPQLEELLNNVTEFTISPFTEEEKLEYMEWDHFAITISSRGLGKWAITNRSAVLNRKLEWGWGEPLPSSRTGSYLKSHRFTLEEAYPLAYKLCEEIRMGHMNHKEYRVWVDNRRAEREAAVVAANETYAAAKAADTK